MKFGSIVRKFRKDKNWTAVELAEKVGISQPYLSQIEGGSVKAPSEAVALALAEALEIPAEALEATEYSHLFHEKGGAASNLDYMVFQNKSKKVLGEMKQMIEQFEYKGDVQKKYFKFFSTYDLSRDFTGSLESLKGRMEELEEKLYPEYVKIIISQLMQMDERGWEYIDEQVKLYKRLFVGAKTG